MLNPFIIKKWAALMIAALLTTVSFAVISVFYGLIFGIGGMLITMVISMFIGNQLLKNPLTAVLEGGGVLMADLNSTGVIRLTIVAVNSPYITGRLGNKKVEDAFDRQAVFQLEPPKRALLPAQFIDVPDESGEGTTKVMRIELSEAEYNDAKFALAQYPVFIFNSQIGSIVTKSFLAKNENEVYAKHTLLYLNRKVDELSGHIRDFGRSIVELLRPKEGIFGNKWVMFIVIGLIGVLAVMFAPAIIGAIKGFAHGTAGALPPSGGSNAPAVTQR